MAEEKASDLQVSLSTIESTNYGDHGERVRTDHEYVPGETVEDLVARVFKKVKTPYMQHDPGDVIEIRVMLDRFGMVSGSNPHPVSGDPF